MPKAFLIDTSRCIACRGCQIACKEWHELPANKTKQIGSHQNPPDLNPYNYKVVCFSEYMDNSGVVHWHFFPDQCRHCLYPSCYHVANEYTEGAAVQDGNTGAVFYTAKSKEISKEDFEEIQLSCPYNIPRRDETTGLMTKCDMCNERVTRGLLPVCVQVCPTGAMNFGERKEILELAQKRLTDVKKTHPLAMLADPDEVSVIFLLTDKPESFHDFAIARSRPAIDRKTFFAQLVRPLSRKVKKTINL